MDTYEHTLCSATDEPDKIDNQLLSIGHDDIKELFHLCDANNSGFIEKPELRTIIPNADCVTLERLLNELDCDGDGKISFQELENGFHKLTGAFETAASNSGSSGSSDNVLSDEDSMDRRVSWSCGDLSPGRRRLAETFSLSADDEHYDTFRKSSTLDLFGTLNSHYEAYLVYQHLAQQDTQMLEKYEVFLREAVQKIKEQNNVKEELEYAFIQEQKKQQERLDALEEEAEIMTRKIEQKTIQQLESKHEEDRAKYEQEISVLQENLDQMKQLQQDLRQQAKLELISAKDRLQEMEKELKRLHNEKREADTNALMAKSQLATYKQTVEMQSTEQQKEDWVIDYMTEQENLVKQVEHLQDMNKQLHEANNDLTGELSTVKKKLTVLEPRKFEASKNKKMNNGTRRKLESTNPSHSPKTFDQMDGTSSGVSLFEELENASIASVEQTSANMNGLPDKGGTGSPEPIMQSPEISETPQHLLRVDNTSYNEVSSTQMGDTTLHKSEESLTTDNHHSETSQKFHKLKKETRKSESHGSNESLHSTSTQLSFVEVPPERMYKVIFAGDSGVGKTSFITHFCKGVFQPNVSSTLGIDFYAKNIEVDNTKISVQLWDTAGQERFRCISTSYFRKADGVILLYDCCSERSFMNVREWVATIRQASETENLPIMTCANKIDIRGEKEELGFKVITTEMGEELANHCKTMFCELSAKTGEKMHSCVNRLGRVMKQREDEGIERYEIGLQVGRNITSKESKMNNCC